MQILLIEDDEDISRMIIDALEGRGYDVTWTGDGGKGLELFETKEFDLTILDVMLPTLDGFEILKKVRASDVDTPCLVLSAKRSVENRVYGLQLGGDDYLTKPFAMAELLIRVEVLLRRGGQSQQTLVVAGKLSLDRIAREVWLGQEAILLQPQEFRLLEFLLLNKNKIVSRKMILQHVWQYDFDPGTNVVEAVMSKLRTKLGADCSKQYIKTIRGAGYSIQDD